MRCWTRHWILAKSGVDGLWEEQRYPRTGFPRCSICATRYRRFPALGDGALSHLKSGNSRMVSFGMYGPGGSTE